MNPNRIVVMALVVLVSFCQSLTVSADAISASKPVGTPAGSLSVSPLGAAVYTMPISAPKGYGDMQPNIALTYNSQTGYGIAGYGVNITGLSVITRGCKDIYHDGVAKGTSHIADDAYYLDGKRLIYQSGTKGVEGAVYVPEGEPYTKVLFHGSYSDTSANTWIEVKTQDGITYQYGNAYSARLSYTTKGKSRIHAWLVNRASDAMGRYVNYVYQVNGLNRLPQTITYGMTEGTSNTIAFSYEALKNYNTQLSNIEGVKGRVANRLKTITTSTGSNVYRVYECVYDSVSDASKIRYSRLTRLIEKNGSGESLNPIQLDWKALPSFSQKATELNVDVEAKNYAQVIDDKMFLCADMNGDGISDIIKVANIKDNYQSGGGSTGFSPKAYAYIFLSKVLADGSVKYEYKNSFDLGGVFKLDDLGSHLTGNLSMDMDGDGKSDIVIQKVLEAQGKKALQMTFINGNMHEVTGTFAMQNSSDTPLTLPIDVDHNGKDEYFCIEKGAKSGKYSGAFIRSKSGNNLEFIDCSFALSKEPQKVFAGDYNNDGLSDLLFLDSDGYTIYYNQGGSSIASCFDESHKFSSNSWKNQCRVAQGDFNGDGLVDFVYFQQDWDFFFALNNGDGTFDIKKAATLDITDRSTTKDDAEFSLLPYDMDGDGKTDLMIVKGDFKRHHDLTSTYYRYTKTLVAWLRSDGTKLVLDKELDFSNEDDAKEAYYALGCFTTDGQVGVLHYGKNILDYKSEDAVKARLITNDLCSPSMGKIIKIADGLGSRSDIVYSSLVNPACYTLQENAQFPIVDVHVGMPVVSSLSLPNGAAGTINMSYKYEGLKGHAQGKGVLGFAKTTVINNSLNESTETEMMAWDASRFVPSKVRTLTKGVGYQASSVADYTLASKNNTYFSYVSQKVDTDADGFVTKSLSLYDINNGYVTSQCQYFDGDNMYKKTLYGGYQQKGGVYLPTQVTQIQKHSDDTKEFARKTLYVYNNLGEVIQKVDNSGTSLALTTKYAYDKFGNVVTQTSTGIGVSALNLFSTYDATGRFLMKTEQNPSSFITEYSYDVWGNVKSKAEYADASNKLVTTYTYDGWNRLVSSISPLGITTKIAMQSLGNNGPYNHKITTTVDYGPTTMSICDAYGRELVAQQKIEGNLTKVVTTSYDKRGQKTSIQTTYGKAKDVQRFTYDNRGRVTQEQTLSGKHRLDYQYDGRTMTTIDGSKKYVRTVDAWGSVKSVTDPVASVTYGYYSNGQPAYAMTNGSAVKMTYDEVGNKISLSDPDAGVTTYSYAADGKLLSQKDARGIETKYTYDTWGKLLTKEIGSSKISYTYGSTGIEKNLLVATTLDNYSESYTHDKFGRLTKKVRNAYPKKNFETYYEYNSKNQLAKVTYPGGLAVSYAYDDNGYKVSSRSNGVVLDSLVSYDGLNMVRQLPYGMTTKQVLGEDFRLKNTQILKGNSSLFDMGFEHDVQTGNLLSRTGMLPDKETFEYDDLDRLVSVKVGNKESQSVTYADNGNIQSKTEVGNYLYGAKPHAVASVDNSDAYQITNDVQTEFNDLGKVSIIQARPKNMVAVLTFNYGSDMQLWNMNYLPKGARDLNINQYRIWSRYYDDDYELYKSASYNREFYYLTDHVMAVRDDEKTFKFYVVGKDNLGSVLDVYDQNAAKVFAATYDAWGKQTVSESKDGMDLMLRGYCGHEMLSEFDLINMKGRLYDPVIGRFLSPDNYVQTPDDSQNFNRYSYCLNNPLKYTDPSGELFVLDDIMVMATGGIINLGVNLVEGNVKSLWHGAALFALGAAAGECALYGQTWASSLLVGGGNSIVNQGFSNGFNHIDWMQVGNSSIMSLAITPVSGVLEQYFGGIVSKITSNISDNLLRNFTNGTLYGALSGMTIGTGFALASGEKVGTALLEGLSEAGVGAVTGGLSGLSTGIVENHQQQKDAILNMSMKIKVDPEGIVKETLSNPKTPVGVGTNSVYVGRDEQGDVRYVGITDRDPGQRFAEHLKSGTNRSHLRYRKLDGTGQLSRTQARIIEQKLINAYGMKQYGGVLFNKVNSIQPGRLWSDYGIVNN